MLLLRVPAKNFFFFLCWPLLFSATILLSAYGFACGHPLLYFNITYCTLVVVLLILEMYFPFSSSWCSPDGQNWVNIAHTLNNKGIVQLLVIFSGILGISDYITSVSSPSDTVWPRNLPIALQVVMVCIIAEFMLYWVHRITHLYDFLWRFHSIHHSVIKLWVINTGRFHFMDSLMKISAVMLVLIVLGTPMEVLQWFIMITAYIGVMTHCNVDMRSGFLSYIFNTPEVHRWHHSRNPEEGNNNYGENIVLWDHLFGTYFRPLDKQPPVNIGIDDTMPASFMHQVLYPFRRAHYRTLDSENRLMTSKYITKSRLCNEQ